MWSDEYETTMPLKFLIIIHNYANVKTINQLKSLLGFRVVTSLDGINCQFIQTLLKGEDDSKTSNRLKFRLGKPMVLVQNWKLLLGLFSDKIGLEIIFDDHLVRKQALLDYKKADFTEWPYWIFSKVLSHYFSQKLENSAWFIFGQNRPRSKTWWSST